MVRTKYVAPNHRSTKGRNPSNSKQQQQQQQTVTKKKKSKTSVNDSNRLVPLDKRITTPRSFELDSVSDTDEIEPADDHEDAAVRDADRRPLCESLDSQPTHVVSKMGRRRITVGKCNLINPEAGLNVSSAVIGEGCLFIQDVLGQCVNNALGWTVDGKNKQLSANRLLCSLIDFFSMKGGRLWSDIGADIRRLINCIPEWELHDEEVRDAYYLTADGRAKGVAREQATIKGKITRLNKQLSNSHGDENLNIRDRINRLERHLMGYGYIQRLPSRSKQSTAVDSSSIPVPMDIDDDDNQD